jgi:hypothetical protein
MGQSDWDFMGDGLSQAQVDRGVTGGIARPNGGGNFLFGFNSLVAPTDPGNSVALHVLGANFNPLASGGRITGALKRGTGAGKTGFSPFLFLLAQANSVNALAYMLGLEDADPNRIVLRKGYLNEGIPAADTSNALRISTETFDWDVWHHLRLDAVVNATGDVVLKVFRSDLDTDPVDTPDWQSVAGMDDFIDDALGINSGSAPFTSGYVGFGMHVSEITRRGFFDHIEVFRQTAP